MIEFPQNVSDPIEALIGISRFYGSDPSIVLAGGGNTSVKIDNVLHVKASGFALATIGREGFVALDRTKLQAVADADFGSNTEQREIAYKNGIMNSRLEPEKNQRPSVEALLHHLVPGKFVVHTHATLVNTVTCAANGEKIAKELFGDTVLWIPFVDPGYTLGRALKNALASRSTPPQAIFMANHGLIVAGDEPQQIKTITDRLLSKIADKLGYEWFMFPKTVPVLDAAAKTAAINTIAPALRGLMADNADTLKVVTFDDSPAVDAIVHNDKMKDLFAAGPLNPDQIVYCNSFPLVVDYVANEATPALIERLSEALAEHQRVTRFPAKLVLVRGLGMFAAGDDLKQAQVTRDLCIDTIKIMGGATRLGGVQHMARDKREFIENWEVEAYRKAIARASAKHGRSTGKIAIVTGAAQGFGLEIAQTFAAEGGHVALADINEAGAQKAAAEIPGGRGMGVAVNVTSSESIAACIHQVVRKFGGFDVFVNNAGVLKAASVKAQTEKDFDFVTAVNYKGYFFCVQKAAPIMAVQHQARPGYMSDIIQINSKSGLQGSNKNGSYAGSKFGGIGLTQSFALELIEDGIKVNSICPGNFFDGPLWSDPKNGLFVQYLNTGKVPGAKSIADVKKFYEAKVPMGRGCTTPDVMKAVFYLMEQKYETGQAVPVTGGQVMLS